MCFTEGSVGPRLWNGYQLKAVLNYERARPQLIFWSSLVSRDPHLRVLLELCKDHRLELHAAFALARSVSTVTY